MVDKIKGKAVKRKIEADVSIDTDTLKNGIDDTELDNSSLSDVENKLMNIISISRHFDNLDGVKIEFTPKGNIHVLVNGNDLITFDKNILSDEDISKLEELGYFDKSNFGESETLTEDEVPASQLDFKHSQLAKVQSDIKTISELKAEDTSNELYTELLDAYDKIVSIITDSIAEDPVGTVVGDGFDTGLNIVDTEISTEPEELPMEDADPIEEV